LRDDKARVDRLASETLDAFLEEADTISDKSERNEFIEWVKKSANIQRLRAMIECSHHLLQLEQWRLDSDPMLLNFDGVTVDLSNGTSKPNNPSDFCTKIASAKYDPDAGCPQFSEFLKQITGGSDELIKYLQRAAGYSLTASNKEQCFFIAHGSGANGKSVFLNLIREMLGSYGDTVPMKTLMALDRTSGIPNDVARLDGARIVTASEGERHQKLATSFIKQITGGDPVMARFMYKEFFYFIPVFKLWMATNHKPDIPADDPAMWRRVHLIPFNVTIPKEDQDKDLPEKLRNEMSGVLNWAIEGAVEWNKNGLNPPEIILSATDDYHAQMDTFARFCKEVIVKREGTSVPKKDVFNAYQNWQFEEGGENLSMTDFRERMVNAGFEEDRTKVARVWKNIELQEGSLDGSEDFGIIN